MEKNRNNQEKKPIKLGEIHRGYHDYGVDSILLKEEIGWNTKHIRHKNVFLEDIEVCRDRITVKDVALAWRGMGKECWEVFLAGVFVDIVKRALEKKEKTAEITRIFNYELIDEVDRSFSEEQIRKLIMPSFDVISDDGVELKLKLRTC